MRIHGAKEILQVSDADLTGSSFDDVKMPGATFENINMRALRVNNVDLTQATITNANLTGAAISDSTLQGMTIEGILVTELLRVYRTAASSECSVLQGTTQSSQSSS